MPDRLAPLKARLDAALDRLLPAAGAEPRPIHEAMRYGVLGGGKRLRPLLVLAAAEAAGAADLEPFLPSACALELIHAYSLIHDDLPSMDDDDLRRGRPTCHRVYGEANAILAGDALLTLAFRLLAEPVPGVSAERQLAVIAEVGDAAGTQGLVGGQVADLAARGATPSLAELQAINRRKTGALFRAAVRAGALLAGAAPAALEALTAYAEGFGLAFQVLDDLDDDGPLPVLIGRERARALAGEALDGALARLAPFGPRADLLRALAQGLLARCRREEARPAPE